MATWTPLQSVTLSSNQASVTLSNIDQTYTDLVLVSSVRGDTAAISTTLGMQLNGDASTNYSSTYLRGYTTTASSSRISNQSQLYTGEIPAASSTSGGYSAHTTNFYNYSTTGYSRTIVSKNGNPLNYLDTNVNTWSNTTAGINTIKLFMNAGNIAAGSSFSLYGISAVNAKVSQASGGTFIAYDSSYVYHVFKGTGTFTPNRAITADVLVVAGGGGNGANWGAGGGAGGVVGTPSVSFASGVSYLCTVGAGGPGNGSSGNGTQGNNSNITGGSLSLTAAIGGGYGAGGGSSVGGTGGSGGGSGSNSSNLSGGLGTSGQGNNGGAITAQPGTTGGGGAGGAGTNETVAYGRSDGGVGTNSYSAWGLATNTGQNSGGTVYYAGGGSNSQGSGVGGLGGGGTGTSATGGGNGTTNTGGGAGASGSGVASQGGSGIIIVRYAR